MVEDMTVGEAIKRIKEFALHHAIQELPNSARTVEAFEMAIDALEIVSKIVPCGKCANRKYCEHPQKVDSDWFCADGEGERND